MGIYLQRFVSYSLRMWGGLTTSGILPVSNKLRSAKAMSVSPKDRDR